LSPKQFFNPTSPRIAAEWLKHDMWHTLTIIQNHYKFGWNWGVTKATLLLTANSFSSVGGFALQWGDWNITCGTPSTCATISACLSELDTKEGHFTHEVQTLFRLYLALQCSCVTQTSYVALHYQRSQPVQVWSKPSSNKGHFTLEAKTVSRLYLLSHNSPTSNGEISHNPHSPIWVEGINTTGCCLVPQGDC
jgi:hypothetical protein